MKGLDLDFEYKNSVLTLPRSVVNSLGKADAAELSVLIALAAAPEGDADEIAATAGVDGEALARALDFWRGAGVISLHSRAEEVSLSVHTATNGNRVSVVSSGDVPHYSGREIEALFSENGELRGFIDECARILGKMLNNSEINKLIALIDVYRFSCDYVLLLVGRCVEIGKGSLPYIFKTGVSLYNGGVVTVEALEERIRDEESRRTVEGKLRTLLGIGERAFTEREKKFIANFAALQIPDDMLELAYNITVDNTAKPSMPYMNKVLTTWREAGYKSADDVRAAIEAYKQKKSAMSAPDSSFNKDEFFEAALRRSMDVGRRGQTSSEGNGGKK